MMQLLPTLQMHESHCFCGFKRGAVYLRRNEPRAQDFYLVCAFGGEHIHDLAVRIPRQWLEQDGDKLIRSIDEVLSGFFSQQHTIYLIIVAQHSVPRVRVKLHGYV